MYQYLSLIFVLVLSFGLKAQNLQQTIGKSTLGLAEQKYAAFDYAGALTLYEKEYAKNTDASIAIKIARSNLKLQNREEAFRWLKIAGENQLDNALKYNMAVMYAHANERDQALSIFDRLDLHEVQLKNWQHFDAQMPSVYQVNPAMEKGNYNTYASMHVNDGLLFFTDKPQDAIIPTLHNWTGEAFPAMHYAPIKENGRIGKAQPASIQGLSAGYAGPLVPWGDQLIMGITNTESGKMQLWECAYDGNGQIAVGQPLLMGGTHYTAMHPAIYKDSLLIFSAELPEGYGGMDLFSSVYNGESWSKPKNLGPMINTPGHEVFAYCSLDNGLFFSSDGHPGFGGLDIYKVNFSDTNSLPMNLGPAINSSAEDFAYHELTSFRGYFSSSRNGVDEIFSYKACIGTVQLSLSSDLSPAYLTVNGTDRHEVNAEATVRVACKAGDMVEIFFQAEEVSNSYILEMNCTILSKGTIFLDGDLVNKPKPSNPGLSQ